jgi:hypothetical protein
MNLGFRPSFPGEWQKKDLFQDLELNGGPTADPPFRGLLLREKHGIKGG